MHNLNIKLILFNGDNMDKNKIIYASSHFIFFLPLLFSSLNERKYYANKGLLILLSWAICYISSFILHFFMPHFINIVMNIITYVYPLTLAIKGAYMVYKEKEWEIPFLNNLQIIKY